ncbi:MAG: hypothetical protein V4773_27665 [Verrucomicrobiota bacterium]
MSAVLSIGEANHRLLNSDAELGALQVTSASPGVTDALIRARNEIAEARAILAAVRLTLLSHNVGAALAHHEYMAVKVRDAARLARMIPGRGLYIQAEAHEQMAKALRTLVGPVVETVPAEPEGGVS